MEKNDATSSGTAYIIFTLKDGSEVFVDADGFVTLDGEQLPAGEHPLSDTCILVVDGQGQFVETKQSAHKVTDPEQAVAPQTLAENLPEKDNGDNGEENLPTGESAEALKEKIAELESKLSELAGLAREANAEVQKLRKKTPSTLPLSTSNGQRSNNKTATRHEQMAHALSQTIKSRK